MKLILTNEWHDILRFDAGDDVIVGILEHAKKNGIEAAWFSAIGSAKEIELGFYDLEKKVYNNKMFSGPMELLDASGTLSLLDGEPAIHIHGVFGNEDYGTVGGHVHTMRSHATVEVFIHKIEGRLERKNNPDVGLNLLS